MCVSSRTAGAPLHDAAPRPGMTSLLAGSHSPRPPHLAPPTPQPVARLCSSASQLLLRSLTSHVRSSSATTPRLPDAGQSGAPRSARRGISRFPSKELLHMPGSSTTPGRSDLAMVRPKRVAFRARNSVGARGLAFAAPWLAYALPYRRFVGVLTDANAQLGADVDRYTFIVVDLHHLLLAGLPAHFESSHASHAVRSLWLIYGTSKNSRHSTRLPRLKRARPRAGAGARPNDQLRSETRPSPN